MNANVSTISKAQVTELLSAAEGAKLSEVDLIRFNQYVDLSTVVWAGSIGDKLLCMWGLIPPTLLSDQAYLWLHTTKAAEAHTFILVRRGQIELRKMLADFPNIIGHCDVEAARSIRWLKWLGAQFGEPGDRFIPFVIRSQNG